MRKGTQKDACRNFTNMKIYTDLIQGSPEWHALRAENFTASELGPFALEPVKVTLNVEEIKRMLDQFEIPRKGVAKRDELLALLPNPEFYAELCGGARTAIISKIKQERMLRLSRREVSTLTAEECILLDRDDEIRAKEDRSFEYNIPVKYGKLLEPFARACYQELTGYTVTEVGFIEATGGGWGCSPDGLVYVDGVLSHGVEIKCPTPEVHLDWLLAGGLPDEHKIQVHTCMAAAELLRWDFLSYCPGETPLLVTVQRDDDTEQLAAGLKTMVAEKAMRWVMTGLRLGPHPPSCEAFRLW